MKTNLQSVRLFLVQAGTALLAASASAAPYSIGEPSDTEQYLLELVNRARMYPDVEGGILSRIEDSAAQLEYDFFRVDLDVMESELALHPPLPPLVLNMRLSEMARSHATDMLLNAFQGHVGSDGGHVQARAEAAGYGDWTELGENAFSYAESAEHTHASFEVDWGSGPFGMQDGRPHRENIHGARFSEIGIASIEGENASVGPGLVVQEFGDRESAPAFVTGVVYFDLDGNRFYDPGEGVGGALVTVSGTDAHAITSASGGYAVPVLRDGTYDVTIRVEGLPVFGQTVTIVNGENVKLDHVVEWQPPRIVGPATLTPGSAQPYRVTRAPGTAGSDVLVCRVDSTPLAEGAEASDKGYQLSVDPRYRALQKERIASGSSAFHLAHPDAASEHQTLTLNRIFVPGAGGELRFKSLLALADSGQIAKVQFSRYGSDFWSDLYARRADARKSDREFADVRVDLSPLAGQWIRVRFVFFVGAGYVLEGADSKHGWFFDDIKFAGTEEITHIREVPLKSDETFHLLLPEPDQVRLYAQARGVGSLLPPAGALNVRAAPEKAPHVDAPPLSRLPGRSPVLNPPRRQAPQARN